MRQGKGSSLSRATQQAAGRHKDNSLPLFSATGWATQPALILASFPLQPPLRHQVARMRAQESFLTQNGLTGLPGGDIFTCPTLFCWWGSPAQLRITLNQPPSAARATGKHQHQPGGGNGAEKPRHSPTISTPSSVYRTLGLNKSSHRAHFFSTP